jgi:hypothetical protein
VNIDFDLDQYEASRPVGVLPEGKYQAVITTTTEKTSRNGNRYVEFELEVIAGEHQGRKLWDNLNLWHPDSDTQKIARGTLKAICEATIGRNVSDTSQLCNHPLLLSVGVKDNTYNGTTSKVNRVKGYAKLERSVPQQSQAPVAQPRQDGQGRPW